jgi:hypothetical protein
MTDPLGIPRRFDDLPPHEARAIFDAHVADHEPQAAALIEEVRDRGGPADQLDFSVESLEPLWRWFIGAHSSRRFFGNPHRRPRRPYTDAELPITDQAPWWAAFHPGFYRELGPLLAWTVTRLSAYYVECAMRASPGSRWVIGKGRTYAFYQQPVLELAGRGERPYSSPIVIALQGLRRERDTANPDALRRSLEQWLGLDPEYEAQMRRLSQPVEPFSVTATDHPTFSHAISFDDEIGHRQSRRVDRLVTLLAADSRFADVVREDREVILLRAVGVPEDELEEIVGRLWRAARRGQ